AELRAISLATVAAKPVASGARGGLDDSRRIDTLDVVVQQVRDKDMAGSVGRHAAGIGQRCTRGGSTVAPAQAIGPGAGDRRDDAGRVDATDAVVDGVCDVDVAKYIDRDASGRVDLGGICGTSVAGEPG